MSKKLSIELTNRNVEFKYQPTLLVINSYTSELLKNKFNFPDEEYFIISDTLLDQIIVYLNSEYEFTESSYLKELIILLNQLINIKAMNAGSELKGIFG